MRILFLTSQVPYPPRSGSTIKSGTVLDYLREQHEVHVYCFRDDELDDVQREWSEAQAQFESVKMRRGRNPVNLARSYASRVPLSIHRNRSGEMSRLVEDAVRNTVFHAVFVDGWLMAQYVPDAFAGRRLLHEHNAEYVMWERQASVDRSPFRRPLVRAEARRVRRYEASILEQFDTVFAVSEEDRLSLIEIGGNTDKVRVLPNVPEPALLERPALRFAQTQPAVLYFGTLSWPPNVEGLERFLRDVWPLVHRQIAESVLVIAGQGASRNLARLAGRNKGVELVGEVDDQESLYSSTRVFVEATRSGGGTKVKLLNAMARGLPVVASREAVEGLDVKHDEHVLIADGPSAMAAAVVRLYEHGDVWTRLSENGRALVRQRYTPEVAYAVLDDVLSDAAAV